MLWTEITRLVTRDGKTHVGEQVREWLKERGVLAADDDSREIAIRLDPRRAIVLRTRDEVQAWLIDSQLAREVTLGPRPPAAPRQRQAVRGPNAVNRNDIPMTVDFVRADDGVVITDLALGQGQTERVGVRFSPAPKRSQKHLELALIGAKIRSRPAIRSVKDSTTGYLYLSRVRLARNRDGIRDPLPDLGAGVYTKAYHNRSKSAPHHRIEEFSLLGLEAGTERLQAAIIDEHGALVASATLTITVALAPTGVGALRVFHNTTVDAFKAADPEFDAIHPHAPNKTDDVKLGVCDTGIFDDSNEDNYLAQRWTAGRYFDGDPGRDRDTKPGGGEAHHILNFRESPSLHGTNVSGQAAWGSAKIKLVDIMVQRGQEMGTSGVDQAAAAAGRAFEWARDTGQVSVVNCSKVIPFRKAATNDVVSDPATKNQVLFLATGGNSDFSFPLDTHHPRAANNEVTADCMPTSMDNTLWGGGCMRDRTPHASRGHGPAVEVMVPSDNPYVYSPRALRRAFRMKMLQKTFDELPGILDQLDQAIVNPPAMLPGGHTPQQNGEYQKLQAIATAPGFTGFTGIMGEMQQRKLTKLTALLNPRPNPDVALKQAYADVATCIRRWTLDTTDEVTRARDLVIWANNLFQANTDLKTDQDATDSAFADLNGVAGAARIAVQQLLNETIVRKNLRAHRTELEKIQPDSPNIASDDGVSFGLPVVANIAAKLKLLDSTLTPNQIKRIIIDTSDIDPGFEDQCIARGIVNPLRAYLAAFDGQVSTGGTPHHDYAPSEDPDIDEPRRVYYSFFYMDPQGLEVYDKIKQRLHDDYRLANIDLVEAEPPLRIANETVTYVAGRSLLGHNWRKVIPVRSHPLLHAPKHLRLVLLNQAAMAEGNPFSGRDTSFTLVYDTGTQTWSQENPVGAKVQLTRAVNNRGQLLVEARIPDAKLSFAPRTDHMVTRLEVLGDGDAPLAPPHERPHEILNPSLGGERHLIFTVTDDVINQHIVTNGRKIKLEFGVIQKIGGASDGANIFVNNSYHAGSSGTSDANDSVLVLFLHEIGHALGMVPETHGNFYQNAADKLADEGFGGDGKHCSFNAEPMPNDEAQGLGVIPDGRSGQVMVPILLSQAGRAAPDAVPCVMYHTRTAVHCKSKFCATCMAVLQGSTLEGRWRWSAD